MFIQNNSQSICTHMLIQYSIRFTGRPAIFVEKLQLIKAGIHGVLTIWPKNPEISV